MPKEYWYRYYDVQYSAGANEYGDPLPEAGPVKVHLQEFPVEKHTPKGVWLSGIDVRDYHGGHYPSWRFVRHDTNKRFACPTIAEARESFLARKRRQIRIHTARIRQAEKAIREMEKICGLKEPCVFA